MCKSSVLNYYDIKTIRFFLFLKKYIWLSPKDSNEKSISLSVNEQETMMKNPI